MFVVDLLCDSGHLFEEWFDNAEAFAEARDASAVECPKCGSTDVELKPSFRGIAMKERARPPSTPQAVASTPPAQLPLEVQRALSDLLKVVRAHTEDVGEQFAEKAIAIHRGDEEARPIHGTSTPEDEARLVDEGVAFAKIPIPDVDVN